MTDKHDDKYDPHKPDPHDKDKAERDKAERDKAEKAEKKKQPEPATGPVGPGFTEPDPEHPEKGYRPIPPPATPPPSSKKEPDHV